MAKGIKPKQLLKMYEEGKYLQVDNDIDNKEYLKRLEENEHSKE